MRFRNVANWTNLDATRGLLYFAQRCEELTFPYSLDSHKSPTTSLQGLLLEALSMVRDAKSAPAARQESVKKSASQIINELSFRVSGNWVAKMCIGVGFEELQKLDSKASSMDLYRRWLEVASAELDGHQYISEIVNQVLAFSEHAKEKRKIDLLAKEFVSTLQGLGVARDHIYSSVVEFFFSTKKVTDSATIKEFCKIVYPHFHQYTVAIGVSKEIKKVNQDSLKVMDILILDEDVQNDWSESKNHASLKDELNSTEVALVSVKAMDYNSAVNAAKSKIDEVAGFFKIFSHKSMFSTSDNAIAIQACCEGESKTIDLTGNHMHYIRDMRMAKASMSFKKYHDGITLDVGRDDTKFKNVVNIHGMSLSVASPDIQLVNIWTCLETISPSHGEQSNIDSVVNAVIPAIMLGYMNRLVVNTIFDVLRWDRKVFSHALKKAKVQHLPDLRAKFVALLTVPENEAALKDLLGRCRDFELLRFRIYTLAELLRDPKKIKGRIEVHQKLVTWQIYRIYRTRNRIVHSGESPEFTGYLVENAHDFFDIALMFCLDLSNSKNGYDTFESCFDFSQGAYKRYLSNLDSSAPIHNLWTLPKRRDRSFIFERNLA